MGRRHPRWLLWFNMRFSSKQSSYPATFEHSARRSSFSGSSFSKVLFILIVATLAILFAGLVSLLDLPTSVKGLSHIRYSSPKSANVAFLIQIVPSSLGHLPRLFRRIYHPENVYGLHFDVKIPQSHINETIAQLQSVVPTFQANTYLIPRDVIVYDGVSMVLNTLAAITFLLDASNDWDFFINLSGNDYPLTDAHLPRELLTQVLPLSPNFFSMAKEESWRQRFKVRAERIVVDPSLTHSLNNPDLIETSSRNPIFDNVTFIPVHAEAWMILSRRFCEYLIRSPTSRRMLLTVGNMRGSDEFYFASLAYNHPEFNKSIISRSFRKVIWVQNGVHAGQHPYNIDIVKDGQYVFLEQLRTSPQWHARKFMDANSELMDKIDAFSDDPERAYVIRREFGKAIKEVWSDFNIQLDAPPLSSSDLPP